VAIQITCQRGGRQRGTGKFKTIAQRRFAAGLRIGQAVAAGKPAPEDSGRSRRLDAGQRRQ